MVARSHTSTRHTFTGELSLRVLDSPPPCGASVRVVAGVNSFLNDATRVAASFLSLLRASSRACVFSCSRSSPFLCRHAAARTVTIDSTHSCAFSRSLSAYFWLYKADAGPEWMDRAAPRHAQASVVRIMQGEDSAPNFEVLRQALYFSGYDRLHVACRVSPLAHAVGRSESKRVM